jgi:hypothetical protein
VGGPPRPAGNAFVGPPGFVDAATGMHATRPSIG